MYCLDPSTFCGFEGVVMYMQSFVLTWLKYFVRDAISLKLSTKV